MSDRKPSVFPGINAEAAVYDRKTGETLISDDGIRVKKQKTVRKKAADRPSEDPAGEKRRKGRINTDVKSIRQGRTFTDF